MIRAAHSRLVKKATPMTVRRMTQKVSAVRKENVPFEEISMKSAIEQLVGGPIESCSDYARSVVGRPVLEREPNETAIEMLNRLNRGHGVVHPFVNAVHHAYQSHRPLVVSPDMFWLLITQGLARHINNNPEELRKKFVNFSGKQCIEVRFDGFIKGAIENSWEEVFAEFSRQIRQRIGDGNYSTIVAEFSTTGRVEKAAFEIVLMDCVKNYFDFALRSLCGIPEVVIEGEPDDWIRLRDKTMTLGEKFNLNWWTDKVVPILDQIAENASGKENPELWENIYKDVSLGSGTPLISGWIAKFFPYLGREGLGSRNPMLDDSIEPKKEQPQVYGGGPRRTPYNRTAYDEQAKSGISVDSLPGSLSKAPFVWQHRDQIYQMEFLAGFTGFTQNVETFEIRPKIGWAVREVTNEE